MGNASVFLGGTALCCKSVWGTGSLWGGIAGIAAEMAGVSVAFQPHHIGHNPLGRNIQNAIAGLPTA